jgi:hypothetical protein
MSDVEISNVTQTLTGASWSSTYGPLNVDGVYQVLVEDVYVHDNDVTIAVESGSARAYAPWLGQFGSDRQDAIVRRVRVEDNTFAADATWVYAYGLAMRSYYEGTVVENLVVARNTATGITTRNGTLFYGRGLLLTNADVVDNDFGESDYDYGLIFAYGEMETQVVNVNVVGNAGSAESTPYGTLVSLASDEATLTWDSNNVYDNELSGTVDFRYYDGTEVGGTNAWATDPLYTDRAGGDYTLSSSSPLIDAGHAEVSDADGSASDIGAHGGALAW